MPAKPTLLAYGRYDLSLVALSVLVVIVSSWMGLQIAGQASANRAQPPHRHEADVLARWPATPPAI